MSILSAAAVARHCHQAGFRGNALLTIVAIAKAESGFNAAAVGDTTITDETWGPSVGLLQVRSLHKDRGTGRTRDELANADPAHNALAGWEISAHGTKFSPWSVFTSGTYVQHLTSGTYVQHLPVVWPTCHALDPTVPRLDDDAPVLRRGDVGPAVAALQRRLSLAGFAVAVDAEFGPQTEDALRAFQASRGLVVDGIAGRQTHESLPGDGAPVAGPPARPLLRAGDRGPLVAELQRQLTAAGFPCATDGEYGPQTERAVSDFQASRGLAADGVVGHQTWSALDRVPVPAG